jgi:hypothetical protein
MRFVLIKKLISGLEKLQENLSHEAGCPEGMSDACTALTLGSLVRGISSMAVMQPPVTIPYHGYSLNCMFEVIEGFPRLSSFHHKKSSSFGDTCTVLARMQPVMRRVKTEMKDMDLSYSRS